MPVVGSAEVLIRPTFPGFQREVRKAVQGVGAPAGKQAGSRLGESLKTWGKRAAVGAGVGISAALGGALTGGFKRLSAIEDAKAMLRGLGHSGEEVKGIMKNVADATMGTAVRMDEAAGTAAQLVGAGIKPGKDLENTLRLVADAATIAGGDMQGMSAIFGKTAAANRLSMEEVNQLLDRGIPIFQSLADEMGVSQGAVRDMVSAGKVDFQTFSNAMQETLGGSAKSAGSTMRGALENLGAYLSRVGASLLEGVFPSVKDAINKASDWLHGFEDDAKRIGAAIGDWLQGAAKAIGKFIQEFKDGEGAGGKFRDVVMTVKDVISKLFGFITGTAIPAAKGIFKWMVKQQDWLVPIAAGIFAMIAAWKIYRTTILIAQGVTKAFAAAQRILNAVMRMNPIGIVITILIGLVAAFVTAYKKSETFRNIVNGVWAKVKAAFKIAWDFIKNKVFKPLSDWFSNLGKWFGDLKDTLVGAWDTVKSKLKAGWDFMKRLVFGAFKAYINVWKIYLTTAFKIVTGAWDLLKRGLSAAWNWIKRHVLNAFQAAIRIWRNTIRSAVDRVKSAWNGIKSAFRAVFNWVKDHVFDPMKKLITQTIPNAFERGKDAIGRAWAKVKSLAKKPVQFIVDTVYNRGIRPLWNKVAGVFGADKLEKFYFADGGYPVGRVRGPGGPTDDRVPAMLSNQEHVLSAREVRGFGGHGAVERLRAAARAGAVPAFAGGGWLGQVGGWLKEKASSIISGPWGWLKDKFKGLTDGIGSSQFAQMLAGLPGRVIHWAKEKFADLFSSAAAAGSAGPAPPAVGGWVRPSRGPVTSEFGSRWGGFHAGIDIAGGGPTYAARGGRVVSTGWNIGPGRTGIGILLSHGGGTFTYYGHNPPGGVRVTPGQMVKAGQRIGSQGATGNVTGTHLHFEYQPNGAWGAVNPRRLGIFDDGGLLKPGMMAYHGSHMSQPDAVLTATQWRDVHQLASKGGAGQEFNFNAPIYTTDPDEMARAIRLRQRDALATYGHVIGGV